MRPGFMRSAQLPPEQNSMTIHKSEPLRNEPWYLVTKGEFSSERMDISDMMSSTSSSAFSTSIILMATACPVCRSNLATVSASPRQVDRDGYPPLCRPCQNCRHLSQSAPHRTLRVSRHTNAVLLRVQHLGVHGALRSVGHERESRHASVVV